MWGEECGACGIRIAGASARARSGPPSPTSEHFQFHPLLLNPLGPDHPLRDASSSAQRISWTAAAASTTCRSTAWRRLDSAVIGLVRLQLFVINKVRITVTVKLFHKLIVLVVFVIRLYFIN